MLVFDFFMAITPYENGLCPTAAKYTLNAWGISESPEKDTEILARWDFESDGVWDTDYGRLDVIEDCYPFPIPEGSWVVTGEAIDKNGNSVQKTESIPLPQWVPTLPDIVAGEIRLGGDGYHYSPNDTLLAGEEFTIELMRRDWVNGSEVRVLLKYFIDDAKIAEYLSYPQYPSPNICGSSRFRVIDGIQTVGRHEIRVEAALAQGLVESNINNNSATFAVYVKE